MVCPPQQKVFYLGWSHLIDEISTTHFSRLMWSYHNLKYFCSKKKSSSSTIVGFIYTFIRFKLRYTCNDNRCTFIVSYYTTLERQMNCPQNLYLLFMFLIWWSSIIINILGFGQNIKPRKCFNMLKLVSSFSTWILIVLK